MQKIMSANEFAVAMFEAGTTYADISAFFGSDRRTGHRWQEDGPSNQVARLLQVLRALNLTLDDARVLIAHGISKSKTAVPTPVAGLETQMDTIRKAVRAEQAKARGGKDSSDDRRSKNRAPQKGKPTPASPR